MSESDYRKYVRSWLSANAPQQLKDQDAKDADPSFLLAWQKKLYEAGLLGISWPKEYGGQSEVFAKELLVRDEFLNAGIPYINGLISDIGLSVVGPAVLRFGTADQKLKYIRRILSGEDIWSQGFSEPNAGSDLAAIATEAIKIGSYFEVTGQKIWSSSAPIAHYYYLLARTSREEKKYKGLTMMIADLQSEGVRVSPISQISGRATFGQVYLDKVKVPLENVVGEFGGGWKVAMATLNYERFNLGARVTFSAEQAIKKLVKLLPMTKELEMLELRVKASKSYYKRLLDIALRGNVIEAEGTVLKISASELLEDIYFYAVCNLGPEITIIDKENSPVWPIAYLDCNRTIIAGGTSEISRNVIGERILGLPR